MFKHLLSHFIRTVVNDNRGFADAAAAVPSIGGSLGGGYSSSKTRREEAPPEWVQGDRGPEAEGARSLWWEKLQEFGNMPQYGAVQPDWADIFEQAQQKVRQYYWGSPTSKGAVDKVKASAAARGVSDSPAMEKNMAKMAAEEGNTIGQLSSDMGKEKMRLGENARLNWMQNLSGLTNYNPFGQWYTPWSTQSSSSWDVNANLKAQI